MFEKLSGLKTYLSVALAIAWVVVYTKLPGVKDAVGADNFMLGLTGILGMAGISLRAAVQKTQDAAQAKGGTS